VVDILALSLLVAAGDLDRLEVVKGFVGVILALHLLADDNVLHAHFELFSVDMHHVAELGNCCCVDAVGHVMPSQS
jgi:hypothetical protein